MADSGSRIAQPRSRLRISGTPIIAVMVASLLPSMLPIVSTSPAVPPLGLIMLLGWRLLRPELWPAWIGLPLGFFDDLATGHPVGTAMCLWTMTLVVIDMTSVNLLWRDYWQDWLIATIAIIAVTVLSWLFMFFGASAGGGPIEHQLPQIISSVLLYPLVARLCAKLDRWRLP